MLSFLVKRDFTFHSSTQKSNKKARCVWSFIGIPIVILLVVELTFKGINTFNRTFCYLDQLFEKMFCTCPCMLCPLQNICHESCVCVYQFQQWF